MSHKTKVYRNLTLPKSLDDELRSLAKGKTLMNCYYILYVITLGYNKKGYSNYYNFRPIPFNRFFEMLGSGYVRPLNILLGNLLIERTDNFGPGECFEYRISPNYYEDSESSKVKFYYYQKTDKVEEYQRDKKERLSFIQNFGLLDIPFDKLYQHIEEKVSNIFIDDFEIDERVDWIHPTMKVYEIDENWMVDEGSSMTKKEALLIADQKNKTIIFDGKKVCIVERDYFIMEQKNFLRTAWTSSVDNLADESTLYAKRNNTNYRLDTNFTNLSSELYEIILRHNDMVECDLMNSQPAFLAHILNTQDICESELALYNDLTFGHGLYEYFRKWGLDRQRAKKMIFTVFFGKNKHQNKYTQIFKEAFPNISNYIGSYKWENGDNAFAILLQTIESRVFIDGIYYKLNELGIPVFTKHDSIAYFHRDKDVVERVIRERFDRIKFKGRVRTKYALNKAA